MFSPQQIQNLFSDEFEVAQFTTNSYGNPQLLDMAGFVYSKHFVNTNNTIQWRCLKRSISEKGKKCTAKATTNGNYIIRFKGTHDHT